MVGLSVSSLGLYLGLLLLGWAIVVGARRVGTISWSHRLAVGTGLLALIAFVALGALDGLLVAMHSPDRPSGGMQAVSGFLSFGEPVGLLRLTVHDWQHWYRSDLFSFVVDPQTVVRWYLWIDTVFVLLYATTSVVLLERGRALNIGVQTVVEDDDVIEVLSVQERLAGIATWIVGALVIVDLFENVLTAQLIGQASESFGESPELTAALRPAPLDASVHFLHAVTALKFGLIFAVGGLAVPLVMGLLASFRGAVGGLWATLTRVRALLAVVVVFAVIVLIPLQVPDVIRAWDPPHAGLAVGVAVVLGLVVYAFARRLTAAQRTPSRVTSRQLILAAAVLLTAGALSAITSWGFPGLLVPAGILALLGLLSLAAPSDVPDPPSRAGVGRQALPRVLAAAPLVMIGLAAVRALLADTVYTRFGGEWWWGLGVLLLWGLFPVVAAIGLYLLLERYEASELRPRQRSTLRLALAIVIVLSLLIGIQMVRNVWDTAQLLGALALAGVFFVVVAAASGIATLWVERTAPPRVLSAFGLTRTPLFSLLLIWLLFADLIGGRHYHDVRLLPDAVAAGTPLTADDAWTRWAAQQDLSSPARGGGRRVVPMVFVATSGGGIKAAVWTAFVLDCVFHGGTAVTDPRSRQVCRELNPDRENRVGTVFAASGISGGSLGLVEYVAHEVVSGGKPDPGWIRRVMTDDFVSPNLAWQLFVETPRSLLRYDIGMDRAEVLERAWERGWDSSEPRPGDLFRAADEYQGPLAEGFFAMQVANPGLPLLVLNGATVEGGCRFITSLLSTTGDVDSRECSNLQELRREPPPEGSATRGQIFAASQDLVDLLCPAEDDRMTDVALSTAALLSARFPYVSPSGRVAFCDTGRSASVHIVDGGYLDGSGGASVKEVWDAVGHHVNEWNADTTKETCIVPYLLQIDSGYEATSLPATDAVSEPFAPPRARSSALGSRSIEGRNLAAVAFRQELEGTGKADRYAIVFLRSHPGSQPPLGWTLSSASANELDTQLSLNGDQLSEIKGWFSPDECFPR